ncbi:MAG: CDGSH iron-sulfur domain-containing protein [Cytophagales bacterium]|nr:CDGSH iron-sulfur domain-containing protein [Cytophagales bacterium]
MATSKCCGHAGLTAYGLQGHTIVSLCRCGRSANKPFCDGSHKGNFEHEATAFELPPKKV